MLFLENQLNTEDLTAIQNFFNEYDKEVEVVAEVQEVTAVSRYITSLVSGQYKKSVEDIENTHVGNTRKRKRSLQQVMQESFFSGANRFGNNFIA